MQATALHFLLLTVAGWVNRRQLAAIECLREENRVLRAQLGSTRLKLTDADRRALAVKGRALGRKALGQLASIVTPDTILAWYRKLVAAKYDGTGKRGCGRPCKAADVRALVVRMARENPRWGYTRIVGAMKNLGHELYFVFFAMELKTRRVHIAGIVHQPHGTWMMQVGRNLLDAAEGFLIDKRYLILDRDPLYTAQFRRLLRDSGVTPLRLPSKSPNLNAHAERFVRSIREDCLNHVVLLGEGHLRAVVSEYVEHYHAERNHQGIGNQLIEPGVRVRKMGGKVRRRRRLGGLLSYYKRDAA